MTSRSPQQCQCYTAVQIGTCNDDCDRFREELRKRQRMARLNEFMEKIDEVIDGGKDGLTLEALKEISDMTVVVLKESLKDVDDVSGTYVKCVINMCKW